MDEGHVTTVFEKNFKRTLLWAGPLVGTWVLVWREKMCVRNMWCFCCGLRAGFGNYALECKNPMWHNEKHTSVLLPKLIPNTGQFLPRPTVFHKVCIRSTSVYKSTRTKIRWHKNACRTLPLVPVNSFPLSYPLHHSYCSIDLFENIYKTTLNRRKRKVVIVGSKSTV